MCFFLNIFSISRLQEKQTYSDNSITINMCLNLQTLYWEYKRSKQNAKIFACIFYVHIAYLTTISSEVTRQKSEQTKSTDGIHCTPKFPC